MTKREELFKGINPKDKTKKHKAFYLPKSLIDGISSDAKKYGISESVVLETILKDYYKD